MKSYVLGCVMVHYVMAVVTRDSANIAILAICVAAYIGLEIAEMLRK